jgi:ABC-2 type transport system ATP-binding protein
MIIDRGTVVANGTPAELRARSASAGVVAITLASGSAKDAAQKIRTIPGVDKVETVAGNDSQLRVLPGKKADALAAAILDEVRFETWKIADIHTEEGRLDEVFRSITLPDTKS